MKNKVLENSDVDYVIKGGKKEEKGEKRLLLLQWKPNIGRQVLRNLSAQTIAS